MIGAIVCMSRCWSCMFGDHYDPPRAHTWMDAEDAEDAGIEGIPDPEQHPCACSCARDREKK